MNVRLLTGALVLLVATAGCGDDGDGGDDAAATTTLAPLVSVTAPDESAAVTTAAGTSELAEFCRLADAANRELPESFIGSPEHVEMVEMLASAAPEAIRPQLETYRAFLGSGAVDPNDPTSKETDTWPEEVRTATVEAQEFIAGNC